MDNEHPLKRTPFEFCIISADYEMARYLLRILSGIRKKTKRLHDKPVMKASCNCNFEQMQRSMMMAVVVVRIPKWAPILE
jgi:hypothetical protein